jgi:hypothetical protein
MTPHHISFLYIYNRLPAHNQQWHQLSDECCSSTTPLVKTQSFELKSSTFFFSKLLHQMAGGGAQLSLIFYLLEDQTQFGTQAPQKCY